MSHSKKICITAFCAALCCVLPIFFHSIGLGTTFSPMHLPVLLCGLLCGWPYGAFCGISGPILSALFGISGIAYLPHMLPELLTYGLIAGILTHRVRTGRFCIDIYLALFPAMLAGRVVGGLAQALFYLSNTQSYTLSLWVIAYFVNTLPGIVVQLLTIPIIIKALEKARLIPHRYPASQPISSCF